MKSRLLFLSLLRLLFAACGALAQGMFVYDQESSDDEISPFSGANLQFYGIVGQSFRPFLGQIGFVQLRYFDINRGNALGATVALNLRVDAINGAIIGTATPIVLPDSFRGVVTFFFPAAIPVAPDATYFLETHVQSGDTWGTTILGDTYPNGTIYGGQFPAAGNDLWFREGVIVPEPSVAVLLLGGGVIGRLFRKSQRR